MSADESYLIEAAICKSQAAQEQQELTAAEMGLEDDICGNCGGTRQMDDLIGGKQACIHCK